MQVTTWLLTISAVVISSSANESRVRDEEVHSYHCAKEIASLVSPVDQVGPVFHEKGLVFTSIEAANSSKLLLVNAGAGIFALNIKNGVNRIRFAIPQEKKGGMQTYYLSYAHGTGMRSRYFDFSLSRPPGGRDEIEYTELKPIRAGYLVKHFDYGILKTADNTITAVREEKLSRDQLNRQSSQACQQLAQHEPLLAQKLKNNLDLLKTMVADIKTQPTMRSGRMPASLPAPKGVLLPGQIAN